MVRSFLVSFLSLAGASVAAAVPDPSFAASDGTGVAANYSAAANCTGVAAVSPRCSSNEVLYARDVYYVGGRVINTGSANITADQ